MNRIKTIAQIPVNSFRNHKTAVAVTVTAATCLYLNRIAMRDHDQFLKDHDLFDKYYNAED